MTDRFKPKSRQASQLNRLLVIAIIALVLAAGGLFTWIEAHEARKVMHASMMSEALMLAASLDSNKIARLTGTPADLASPDYHYLRNQLIRIHNANPRYRYLYFFGERSGQPPFFFMGTAAEDSADYSPPGQVYFEDSPTLRELQFINIPFMMSPYFIKRRHDHENINSDSEWYFAGSDRIGRSIGRYDSLAWQTLCDWRCDHITS